MNKKSAPMSRFKERRRPKIKLSKLKKSISPDTRIIRTEVTINKLFK
jgi:hypothetical protein